jgi:hypothetical protein
MAIGLAHFEAAAYREFGSPDRAFFDREPIGAATARQLAQSGGSVASRFHASLKTVSRG